MTPSDGAAMPHDGTAAPATMRPLRSLILTVFLLLTLAISGSIIVFSTLRGQDLARIGATQTMNEALGSVAQHTLGLLGRVDAFVAATAANAIVNKWHEEGLADLLPFLREVLVGVPELDGIYIGYPDGDFVHMVSVERSEAWRQVIKPVHPWTHYVLRRIGGWPEAPVLRHHLLDGKGVELQVTDPVPSTYDPRQRPWYRAALRADGTVLSEPYVFATTRQMGVTLSRWSRHGSVVIGADLTLSRLGAFLADRRISSGSVAFMLTADGRLIAHPDPVDFNAPVPEGEVGPTEITADRLPLPHAVMVRLRQENLPERLGATMQVNDLTYLVQAQRLHGIGVENLYIAIAAPLSEITAAANRVNLQAVLISVGILLLAIPGIILASRGVSRALSRLALEAQKMQRIELDDPVSVPTRVEEIARLGQALNHAKSSLRTFGHYVPKPLVRKIVSAGDGGGLGGVRQEVTIMFTDIQGFTTMSEENPPEVVTAQLSRYFHVASRCIESHEGTIIQFIGDAIYTIWNAPDPVADHSAKACAAALDLAARIASFNADQREYGLPEFITRIGLHRGVVVIGNVGDAERMQYVGVGDPVNTASRIEGMNKQFGTTILVSQAVVDAAGDRFAFQPLGEVQAKGKSLPLKVHELTGYRAEEHPAGTAVLDEVGGAAE